MRIVQFAGGKKDDPAKALRITQRLLGQEA